MKATTTYLIQNVSMNKAEFAFVCECLFDNQTNKHLTATPATTHYVQHLVNVYNEEPSITINTAYTFNDTCMFEVEDGVASLCNELTMKTISLASMNHEVVLFARSEEDLWLIQDYLAAGDISILDPQELEICIAQELEMEKWEAQEALMSEVYADIEGYTKWVAEQEQEWLAGMIEMQAEAALEIRALETNI